MENKDIVKVLIPIKAKIEQVGSYANILEIKSEQHLKEATNELTSVKLIQKELTARKESITKPMLLALKNARAIFAPLEAKVTAAELIIKRKMLTYQNAITAKAEKKMEKIATDVEAGKISFDKGVEKLAKVQEPTKTVSVDNGQITYRTVKKVIIENADLLPREYLVPDEVKIRRDALAGKEIAGVKVVEEKVVSART